jgi:hypothetical protein
MIGALATVESLLACGPRSSPKFGSLNSDQKCTAGSGALCPFGVKCPS